MNTIRAFAAATALVAFAAPAMAADIIVDVPAPPVVVDTPFTWTGAYVGVQVGYVNANGDFDDNIAGTPDLIVDADDIIGGVHAGFNYQFASGFVLGAYVDIDGTNADIDVFSTVGVGQAAVGEINYVARGMVKAGYAIDRALVYAQGGVAYIDADFDPLVTFSGAAENDSDWGYALGAGVDYALTDNVILGADYVYHRFDDLGIDPNILPATLGNPLESEIDAHTFRAKLSYKF